jgi:putative FmdB family regulatory protein
MPFYEYQCSACNHTLEELQKISDNPLTDCPKCKKKSLKKLISNPRFSLKGDGWYETDFKNSKQSKKKN